MENTDRDPRRDDEVAQHTAQDAAPQNDWQNAGTEDFNNPTITEDNELTTEPSRYGTEVNEPFYASGSNEDPDPEDEEDTEDEEDEEDEGDWGHVDPAESNSPFPDSNEPTAPGSAV